MPTRRIARLNEQIRADIAQIVSREMKDPRIAGLVSITSVDLSPDLRHANVFVSVMGTDDDRKHTLQGLRLPRVPAIAIGSSHDYEARP